MNFLMVTAVYVVLSRCLFRVTLTLRSILLPSTSTVWQCFRNLGILTGSFIVCYSAVLFIKDVKVLNLTTLGFLSMAGGSLVHALSTHFAWQSSDDSPPSTKGHRVAAKYIPIPHLAGVLIVTLLGSTWSWMAQHGASAIGPLPATCNIAVQTGGWVPVDLCNQETRGQNYRNYGMENAGTCIPESPTYVWGWKEAPPSSYCHMRQRHSKAVLETLADRSIFFVGDSILRHLYHSMCRQVGDKTAGAYNTTAEKHGNFTRRYGTLDLEFRWAPYTNDTLAPTLQSLFEDEDEDKANLPDAIILGGGAWDQLHRHRNDADHGILVDGIRQVAEQMRRLREAGVAITWVVPTTINTWGLMTEEKRLWLREEDMVNLRTVYKDHGIHDAADFVLEGASFTQDRVLDSYDGVHYPLEVYDAGAQILLNSFDWLLPLPDRRELKPTNPVPRPGSMAHTGYGLVILILIVVATFSSDPFMGLSWLACWLTGTLEHLSPVALSPEAWSIWNQRKNLPMQQGSPSIFARRSPPKKVNGRVSSGKSSGDDIEEMAELMATSPSGTSKSSSE
eukprot:scaffold14782_cov174-Amphora_coffeaeformis.AAC.9